MKYFLLIIVLFLVQRTVWGQKPDISKKKDSLSKAEILTSDTLQKITKRDSMLGIRFQNEMAEQKVVFLKMELALKARSEMMLGVDPSEQNRSKPGIQKGLQIGKGESSSAPVVNILGTDAEEYGLQPVRAFDSRFEVSNLALTTAEHQIIAANSFSVIGIVSEQQLVKTALGYRAINPVTLQQRFNLCPEEPYGRQPVLCFGTAFLIAPDVIVTARHNLNVIPLKKMKFLIGFKVSLETGVASLDFKKDDVYRALTVMISDRLAKLDLAIVRLDRPVVGALPLKVAAQSAVKPGDPVYALGYPLGIPMKYFANASVSGYEDALSFYTTLDTFKGNSGSPVFRKDTHEVIGVLVEGGSDLVSNGSCQVARICSERDCKGEKVINLTMLSPEIARLLKQNNPQQKK